MNRPRRPIRRERLWARSLTAAVRAEHRLREEIKDYVCQVLKRGERLTVENLHYQVRSALEELAGIGLIAYEWNPLQPGAAFASEDQAGPAPMEPQPESPQGNSEKEKGET